MLQGNGNNNNPDDIEKDVEQDVGKNLDLPTADSC